MSTPESKTKPYEIVFVDGGTTVYMPQSLVADLGNPELIEKAREYLVQNGHPTPDGPADVSVYIKADGRFIRKDDRARP